MNEIFTRSSVRQFESTRVENEKIEKILKAGMQAPSAGNQQPWEFYVVKNKEVIEKLSKVSPYSSCAKNAPLNIVIAYRSKTIFPELCQIDCAISTENILLEAEALGLGAVMLAVAPSKDRIEKTRLALNIPNELTPFTIIPIGYPVNKPTAKDRFDKSRVHNIE